MADQSRILELSSLIELGTLQLDNYFKTHDLPTPSLSVNAAPDVRLPEFLFKQRDEILDATSELQALIEGPLAHLTRLTSPSVSFSFDHALSLLMTHRLTSS